VNLQVPDLDYKRFYVTNIAALDDEIFLVFWGHSDKIFVYSTAEMMSELERVDAFRRLKPNTVPTTDQLPRQNMVIKMKIEVKLESSAQIVNFQVVCFHARLSGFSCKNCILAALFFTTYWL
jgi:hypothetical protein